MCVQKSTLQWTHLVFSLSAGNCKFRTPPECNMNAIFVGSSRNDFPPFAVRVDFSSDKTSRTTGEVGLEP